MKTRVLLISLAMILAGCRTLPGIGHVQDLGNRGPAPELTNETWINTDQPLRLADLRGQVVLLDMWTFG